MRQTIGLKAAVWSLLAAFSLNDIVLAQSALPTGIPGLMSGPTLKISFPESVATVEGSRRADGALTVYLVQDAHTNESGQKNIAKILQQLIEKENVKYIFLEAGTGDDSLSDLRALAPPAVRERVAKNFVRQGEVSGAEYLDLVSDRDIRLWGVEDKTLYNAALEAYRFVAGKREDSLGYLAKAAAAAEALKAEIFNPTLRQYDVKRTGYLKGKLSLGDFVETLFLAAKKNSLSLKGYPHLSGLTELKRKESAIDFTRASREQLQAISRIPIEEIDEMLGGERAVGPSMPQAGDIPRLHAFYSALADNTDGLKDFPELKKYLDYLELTRSFSARGTLEELTALERGIYDALIRTDDERQLHEADKNIESLQSLIRLTLTPSEYREYKRRAASGGLRAITALLNRAIAETGAHYEKIVFLEQDFEEYVAKAERFYELTLERDKRFLRNLKKKMAEQNETEAALVVGGYHAPNLKELMQDESISYASIVPAVYHETNLKRYEKILFERAKTARPIATGVTEKLISQIPVKETPLVNSRLQEALIALQPSTGSRLGRKGKTLTTLSTLVASLFGQVSPSTAQISRVPAQERPTKTPPREVRTSVKDFSVDYLVTYTQTAYSVSRTGDEIRVESDRLGRRFSTVLDFSQKQIVTNTPTGQSETILHSQTPYRYFLLITSMHDTIQFLSEYPDIQEGPKLRSTLASLIQELAVFQQESFQFKAVNPEDSSQTAGASVKMRGRVSVFAENGYAGLSPYPNDRVSLLNARRPPYLIERTVETTGGKTLNLDADERTNPGRWLRGMLQKSLLFVGLASYGTQDAEMKSKLYVADWLTQSERTSRAQKSGYPNVDPVSSRFLYGITLQPTTDPEAAYYSVTRYGRLINLTIGKQSSGRPGIITGVEEYVLNPVMRVITKTILDGQGRQVISETVLSSKTDPQFFITEIQRMLTIAEAATEGQTDEQQGAFGEKFVQELRDQIPPDSPSTSFTYQTDKGQVTVNIYTDRIFVRDVSPTVVTETTLLLNDAQITQTMNGSTTVLTLEDPAYGLTLFKSIISPLHDLVYSNNGVPPNIPQNVREEANKKMLIAGGFFEAWALKASPVGQSADGLTTLQLVSPGHYLMRTTTRLGLPQGHPDNYIDYEVRTDSQGLVTSMLGFGYNFNGVAQIDRGTALFTQTEQLFRSIHRLVTTDFRVTPIVLDDGSTVKVVTSQQRTQAVITLRPPSGRVSKYTLDMPAKTITVSFGWFQSSVVYTLAEHPGEYIIAINDLNAVLNMAIAATSNATDKANLADLIRRLEETLDELQTVHSNIAVYLRWRVIPSLYPENPPPPIPVKDILVIKDRETGEIIGQPIPLGPSAFSSASVKTIHPAPSSTPYVIAQYEISGAAITAGYLVIDANNGAPVIDFGKMFLIGKIINVQESAGLVTITQQDVTQTFSYEKLIGKVIVGDPHDGPFATLQKVIVREPTGKNVVAEIVQFLDSQGNARSLTIAKTNPNIPDFNGNPDLYGQFSKAAFTSDKQHLAVMNSRPVYDLGGYVADANNYQVIEIASGTFVVNAEVDAKATFVPPTPNDSFIGIEIVGEPTLTNDGVTITYRVLIGNADDYSVRRGEQVTKHYSFSPVPTPIASFTYQTDKGQVTVNIYTDRIFVRDVSPTVVTETTLLLNDAQITQTMNGSTTVLTLEDPAYGLTLFKSIISPLHDLVYSNNGVPPNIPQNVREEANKKMLIAGGFFEAWALKASPVGQSADGLTTLQLVSPGHYLMRTTTRLGLPQGHPDNYIDYEVRTDSQGLVTSMLGFGYNFNGVAQIDRGTALFAQTEQLFRSILEAPVPIIEDIVIAVEPLHPGEGGGYFIVRDGLVTIPPHGAFDGGTQINLSGEDRIGIPPRTVWEQDREGRVTTRPWSATDAGVVRAVSFVEDLRDQGKLSTSKAAAIIEALQNPTPPALSHPVDFEVFVEIKKPGSPHAFDKRATITASRSTDFVENLLQYPSGSFGGETIYVDFTDKRIFGAAGFGGPYSYLIGTAGFTEHGQRLINTWTEVRDELNANGRSAEAQEIQKLIDKLQTLIGQAYAALVPQGAVIYGQTPDTVYATQAPQLISGASDFAFEYGPFDHRSGASRRGDLATVFGYLGSSLRPHLYDIGISAGTIRKRVSGKIVANVKKGDAGYRAILAEVISFLDKFSNDSAVPASEKPGIAQLRKELTQLIRDWVYSTQPIPDPKTVTIVNITIESGIGNITQRPSVPTSFTKFFNKVNFNFGPDEGVIVFEVPANQGTPSGRVEYRPGATQVQTPDDPIYPKNYEQALQKTINRIKLAIRLERSIPNRSKEKIRRLQEILSLLRSFRNIPATFDFKILDIAVLDDSGLRILEEDTVKTSQNRTKIDILRLFPSASAGAERIKWDLTARSVTVVQAGIGGTYTVTRLGDPFWYEREVQRTIRVLEAAAGAVSATTDKDKLTDLVQRVRATLDQEPRWLVMAGFQFQAPAQTSPVDVIDVKVTDIAHKVLISKTPSTPSSHGSYVDEISLYRGTIKYSNGPLGIVEFYNFGTPKYIEVMTQDIGYVREAIPVASGEDLTRLNQLVTYMGELLAQATAKVSQPSVGVPGAYGETPDTVYAKQGKDILMVDKATGTVTVIEGVAGSRLQGDIDSKTLRSLTLKLWDARPADRGRQFALQMSPDRIADLRVIESRVDGETVLSLVYAAQESGEPILKIEGPRDTLVRERGQTLTSRDLDAQAREVFALLKLSANNTDMALSGVAVPATFVATAHVLPTQSLAAIKNTESFQAQLQLLVSQITELNRRPANRSDQFYLPGFDKISEAQRAAADEILSALPSKIQAIIHIGEPDAKFVGVVLRYELAQDRDQLPTRQDDRTIMMPVEGFADSELVGWYAAFRVGTELAQVFGRKLENNRIDFESVRADDIPQEVVQFYGTKTEAGNVQASELLSVAAYRADLKTFRRLAFRLPIAQKIAYNVLIRAAQMAIRTLAQAA